MLISSIFPIHITHHLVRTFKETGQSIILNHKNNSQTKFSGFLLLLEESVTYVTFGQHISGAYKISGMHSNPHALPGAKLKNMDSVCSTCLWINVNLFPPSHYGPCASYCRSVPLFFSHHVRDTRCLIDYYPTEPNATHW